jgi:hypothetical protein
MTPQQFGYTRGEHVVAAFAAPAATGDITGWALAVYCVRQPGETPLYARTVGDGITITDGPNRVFTVTLPRAITALAEAGLYVLEVWRTDPGFEDRIGFVYVTAHESSFPA